MIKQTVYLNLNMDGQKLILSAYKKLSNACIRVGKSRHNSMHGALGYLTLTYGANVRFLPVDENCWIQTLADTSKWNSEVPLLDILTSLILHEMDKEMA